MPTPAMVKMEMLTNLESFLRKYVLVVPNDNAIPNSCMMVGNLFEVVDMHVHRPGTSLGILSRPFHHTQAFTILFSNPNFFKGGGPISLGMPGYKYFEQLPVHYISITRDNTPQGLALAPSWYALTNTAQIMITPRLTGCSFIIRINGALTEVAHIIPRPGETGQDLESRRQHEANYRDPEAPVLQQYVYGRGSYGYDRDVTIVGCSIGGNWSFYAQKHDLNSYEVRSVHRIFP
jgi:hypothetical protein